VSLLDQVHREIVHTRRIRVLADHIAPALPPRATVLDIGSGDGKLGALLRERRPDISIRGLDVLIRESAAIPTSQFDGEKLPLADQSVDVALLIDVLHHTDDPTALLREAARVARRVILKDHARDGFLAAPTLRFMDRVGNARHGVALPYNYLSESEWDRAFGHLRLHPVSMTRRLGLYPPPASWLFERGLHFVAVLER
jgi:SAM-dependent methyltransferase